MSKNDLPGALFGRPAFATVSLATQSPSPDRRAAGRRFLKLLGALWVAMVPVTSMAAEKPTVVLVHGAWETRAIWDGVSAQLKKDGYPVIAVDLPGRPGAEASPAKVSLDLYRDTVLDAIKATAGPVVLVGHSFGGITISAVAEADPKKVRTLVYLAAFLPQNGESLTSLAQSDKDSKIGGAIKFDPPNGLARLAKDQAGAILCQDCAPNVQAAVAGAIVDEPLVPLATPVRLGASFASVPKVYIHTAHDLVVSPSLQAKMVAATPVGKTYTLQTGHAPFLSDVPALVKSIEDAAKR